MILIYIKLGGTTALVALFVKDTVYIANAGDSRAVLSENDVAIRCTTGKDFYPPKILEQIPIKFYTRVKLPPKKIFPHMWVKNWNKFSIKNIFPHKHFYVNLFQFFL